MYETNDVNDTPFVTIRKLLLGIGLAGVLGVTSVACGGDDDTADAGTAPPAASATPSSSSAAGSGTDATSVAPSDPATAATEAATPLEGSLRLGYFANVTHAPAVIGEQEGIFAEALGDGVDVQYSYFNAGTEAIEALFSGAIDATFIGPNPAINGFAQSDGEALRIVAGTTSGGASLVVRDGIDSPDQLAGTKLASPSLGNTQDVALRAWLKSQGFETDATGGGDVSILPQANADTLTAFQAGDIDGAWVPEPWATRLILEGGGHVLVNEADLWPGGQFVTTHLIVTTEYLNDHPDIVEGLINGLLDAIDEANGDAATAQAATNAGIEKITT
ncbi:MAG: ABC transporter substrate-binding protein, partial [Actinobacteria bacterium]|nr:ABC transporter substrate-binding protein [Actinomycetota bacterium]